jgi:hypothetical protein
MWRTELSDEILLFFDSHRPGDQKITFEQIWELFCRTVSRKNEVIWQIRVRNDRILIYYCKDSSGIWSLVGDSGDASNCSTVSFNGVYSLKDGICVCYEPYFVEIDKVFDFYGHPFDKESIKEFTSITEMLGFSPKEVKYPGPVIFVPSLRKYFPEEFLPERERVRRELLEKGKKYGIEVGE